VKTFHGNKKGIQVKMGYNAPGMGFQWSKIRLQYTKNISREFNPGRFRTDFPRVI